MNTIIDDLLAEQQQLTAVERFSRAHRHHEVPAQARYYRSLIPLQKPRPGEQYAFHVDLDACSGCKACVSACHSLNGLDEDETWRSVGLLLGGTTTEPYQQVVTTACHHCLDPACLNGCPVLAYEKDPDTGIVRHLDDQCIGCQYCILKCPYDVPKYSSRRGIVRKCDLCHDRLASGEAPACVQACPSEAISVRLASREDVLTMSGTEGAALLPGAFASDYTKPTTVYSSSKPLPTNATPADAKALRLESPHWPLVWMLLLTQAAAGVLVSASILPFFGQDILAGNQLVLPATSCVFLYAGLLASVFHLGRPLGAWRAFLGLRRSWMSREIVVFGGFAMAATGFLLNSLGAGPAGAGRALVVASAVAGIVGIFCSAMIYVDTRRPCWAPGLVFPKFFGTALLLGASSTAAVLAPLTKSNTLLQGVFQMAACTALIVQLLLILWELKQFITSLNNSHRLESASPHLHHAETTHGSSAGFQPAVSPTSSRLPVRNPDDGGSLKKRPGLDRAALVAWQLRRPQLFARVGLSALAFITGLLAVFSRSDLVICWTAASFLCSFGAQLIERYLFFVTATAPRMPGSHSE